MKIYVAGPLADLERVQAVQSAVVAAGHELTLDWTRGADVALVRDYTSLPEVSANIAADDLKRRARRPGRACGHVEARRARDFRRARAVLTRAARGDLQHLVILGPIQHESVFYYHPAVQRLADVDEWLASLG